MSIHHRLSALAVVAVLAAAPAGCGDDGDEPAARATPTPTARAANGTAAYVSTVQPLLQGIDDARGDFFKGSDEREAVKRQTEAVHARYAEGAKALAAIDPPAAAEQVHAQILGLWRRRAASLDAVLARKPFSVPRASAALQGTSDKDGAIHDQLFTLPQ